MRGIQSSERKACYGRKIQRIFPVRRGYIRLLRGNRLFLFRVCGSLGTVQAQQVFNIQTMQSEWDDYDNSFMILLFSLFSFVVWAAAAFVCLRSVVNAYALQESAERGEHINTFAEDLRDYLDKKFHITLLTLPTLGIVVFIVCAVFTLIGFNFMIRGDKEGTYQ